jgi:long-chain fatty acid transport protein
MRALQGGLASAAAGAMIFASSPAAAAGLYFADRGVRPLGRAGAFVAGADDFGAITYNPAGLFEAGTQILLDGSWVHFTSEYTRRAIVTQRDPNTGEPVAPFELTFPQVNGTSPVLPIPTLGFSLKVHDQWVIAAGIWAPYAAITTYPEEVDGMPAPQRYSLITLDGSALAIGGAWAAYSPIKNLQIGAGLELLAGSFNATVMFSGCVPDRFACAQEQPEWDVLSQLKVGPIIAPSGNAGVIWAPHPMWRLGASMQLPFYVRAPAAVRTRLPSAAPFSGAVQEGEDADVEFDLPWTLRMGIESRPVERLRIEAGFAFDRWSMHDAITATPDQVALVDVGAGFPKKYYIPEVIIPRNFQDSVSVRVGSEYGIPVGSHRLDARAGVSFETSAVPPEHLSVLTLDSKKVTLALGASFHVGRLRLDATYAHVFTFDVDVDPEEAKIMPVSPIVAHLPPDTHTINGGHYSFRADVIGLGMAYTFGSERAQEKKSAPRPSPSPAE